MWKFLSIFCKKFSQISFKTSLNFLQKNSLRIFRIFTSEHILKNLSNLFVKENWKCLNFSYFLQLNCKARISFRENSISLKTISLSSWKMFILSIYCFCLQKQKAFFKWIKNKRSWKTRCEFSIFTFTNRNSFKFPQPRIFN